MEFSPLNPSKRREICVFNRCIIIQCVNITYSKRKTELKFPIVDISINDD